MVFQWPSPLVWGCLPPNPVRALVERKNEGNSCAHTCQAPMGKTSFSPERKQKTFNLVTDSELTFSYVKIHSWSTDEGSRLTPCMFLDLAFTSSVTLMELQRGSVWFIDKCIEEFEWEGYFPPCTFPPFSLICSLLIIMVFFRDTGPKTGKDLWWSS